MEISTELVVTLPDDEVSMTEIEEAVAQACQKAAQEAIVAVLRRIEQARLNEMTVTKQQVREKTTLTRFGRVRIDRYKVRYPDGRMGYLLDETIGLMAWAEPTPWVRETAATLTAKGNMTYREAAGILSKIVGERVDHRSLWSWVQADGIRARESIEERKREIFERARYPEPGKTREIVVVEADGAFIRDRKERGARMKVKSAILYAGKELVSRSAKHRRYRLTEKVTLATTAGADELAKWTVAEGEAKLGISKAENVLVIGDGADWAQSFLTGWFPYATYQLDHYHLKERLRRLSHGDGRLYKDLVKLALAGRIDDLCRLIRLGKTTGRFEEDAADETIGYLKANEHAIWGSKRLTGNAPKEVLVVGSGAIEKTQDIFVARRMKRRGMRWSRAGAENLLALRSLAAQPRAWQTFWKAA